MNKEQELIDARQNFEIAKKFGSVKEMSKWLRIIKRLEAA